MQRPHALFLVGDQLYADEVPQLLTGPLKRLAGLLLGADGAREPKLPVGSSVVPPLGQPRSALLKRKAGFSTSEGGNHLLCFWEFVAYYLMSFNAGLWPSSEELKTERDAVTRPRRAAAGTSKQAALTSTKLTEELKALEESRSATVALSRLMANTSTLMIFDDHEVTDDWNLTQGWMCKVGTSPIGHRVIANALASFWVFQGYGNDPDRMDCPAPAVIVETMAQYLAGKHGSVEPYVDLMLKRMRWSFAFSQVPPVFCLDTRTGRGAAEVTTIRTGPNDESKEMSDVALMDVAQFEALKTWLAALDRGSRPLIVSPVPLFAFAILETVQRKGANWAEWIAFMLDNEGWRSNPGNFYRFAEALIAFKGESLIILSGDLHFGFARQATIKLPTRDIKVLQLTSSAIRNEAPWAVRQLLLWGGDQPSLDNKQTWWKPENGTIPVLNSAGNSESMAAFIAEYGVPTFDESSRAFDLRRPAVLGAVSARSASLFSNHVALLSFGRTEVTNTFILDPESRERVVPLRWRP
jgi:hypothetical protein